MDIIEAIDAATGCQQCTGPLGDSPSDDFCSEECQETWKARRVGCVPELGERLPTANRRFLEIHWPQSPGGAGQGIAGGLFQVRPEGLLAGVEGAARVFDGLAANRYWLPTATPETPAQRALRLRRERNT